MSYTELQITNTLKFLQYPMTSWGMSSVITAYQQIDQLNNASLYTLIDEVLARLVAVDTAINAFTLSNAGIQVVGDISYYRGQTISDLKNQYSQYQDQLSSYLQLPVLRSSGNNIRLS